MRHRKTSRHRYCGGFTLLEVLLASAILAVLVIFLLCMGNGAVRLWRDGEQRRESLREARAGLQILAEDLHSAVITTNPASLLLEGKSNGSDLESDRLFFLVSHPCDRRNSNSKGDLCATGYFLAKDSDGNGCRNLYRYHASGEQVSAAFEQDEISALYSHASPTNEATTELLARNIIGFEAKGLPEHSNPPTALKITLSAINGTAERLIASEPGATQRNQHLLRKHLQQYSTIIHLPPLRELPPGS